MGYGLEPRDHSPHPTFEGVPPHPLQYTDISAASATQVWLSTSAGILGRSPWEPSAGALDSASPAKAAGDLQLDGTQCPNPRLMGPEAPHFDFEPAHVDMDLRFRAVCLFPLGPRHSRKKAFEIAISP